MELKEGMYVRTKDGKIFKFVKIENGQYRRTWASDNKNITTAFELEDIKGEPSYNIIDLIEVGDYVNGSKVIDISIIGKDKEKWVWVEQMEDTDNKYGDDCVGYNNEQIKSIVTKEQFSQMEYKVEQ